MKVGFIGAGGTGKTTTMRLLSDMKFEQAQSVARSVLTKHNATEETMSRMAPEERWIIQKEMFEKRVELEDELEHQSSRYVPFKVITDRTILDHATYCFYYSANVISDSTAYAMELEVRRIMEKYNKLFYFPLGYFDPPDDGVRKQMYAYRAVIDSIMRGFLRRLALGQYVVPAGTPEQRAEWVRARIKNMTI